MGAKGLGDALLVIDHDIERKIRCSVEVYLMVPTMWCKVSRAKTKMKTELRSQTPLTVSLRGGYVLYISLPIYYEQRVLLYCNS